MLRWGRLKAAEERGKWGRAERRKGREHGGGGVEGVNRP